MIGLPGVMAYGQTTEEAIAKAQAVGLRVLADRIEHGETMASTISKKRGQSKATTPRRSRVGDMTPGELQQVIETSVEHKLIQWFGDPADVRDEQQWARQFAQSQDVLSRLADEALADLRAGKTEPLWFDNLKAE